MTSDLPFDQRENSWIFACVRYLCRTDVWTARVNISTCLASPWQPPFSHPASLYAHQPPSMGLRLCNMCVVNVHRARETPFAFLPLVAHRISYFLSIIADHYPSTAVNYATSSQILTSLFRFPPRFRHYSTVKRMRVPRFFVSTCRRGSTVFSELNKDF